MDFLPSQFFDVEPTTVDTLREKLRLHMDMLKLMDVREFTLYKKWIEVQQYRRFTNRSEVVKAKIWTPTDFGDVERTEAEILALRPQIVFIHPDNKAMVDEWLMLRVFCHSMAFDQNPGRFFRFAVIDEVTGKYLGCTSIGSDVISIKARDKWIGWTQKDRTETGRLKNTVIGTCIMACQPFGYNFLGGKLVASLMADDVVAESWEEMTGSKLVGLTTTSLYGTESMYNGIPYWKKMGATEGKIFLKPDDSVYKEWHHWLKDNRPDEYLKATVKEGINGPITGIKQKILDLAFRTAGIRASKYVHGFKRGVYYCVRYTNAREFFRGEIPQEELKVHPRIAKGTDGITDYWMQKAVNRYRKLHAEGRLKTEYLYYNDLIDMTWEEAKESYLGEIGR